VAVLLHLDLGGDLGHQGIIWGIVSSAGQLELVSDIPWHLRLEDENCADHRTIGDSRKGDESATGLRRALNCLCTGREANCDVARGKALARLLRVNMLKDRGMEGRQLLFDAEAVKD
jgi:hypothetical protein